MLRKIGSKYIFSLLIPVILGAGEIQFSATVSQTTVGLGQEFTLNVTVEGEDVGGVTAPELPPLADFTILNRSSSQSTSIQFINGKMSQQTTITYIYYLSPKRLGKFTIGPCRLKHKDRVYETQPIEIEVVKGSPSIPPSQPSPPTSRTPAPDQGPVENNLMVVASANRKTVYVGEQINVEFSLCTRLNINDITSVQFPSFQGFWAEKLFEATRLNFERKRIDGRLYDVALLKRVALFPMTPGDLKIEPMSMVISIVEPPRDFFDFFGTTRNIPIESKSLTIKVLPLPEEGRPAEFSGGVGNFSIKAGLDKDSSKQGEPVYLTVRISGTGNIRLIEKPAIPTISGLKILTPETKEAIQTAGDLIRGYKEFRYPVIPQTDGGYLIPPIRIAYYDLKMKGYKVIETDPLKFIASGTAVARGQEEASGLKVMGTDINYIKADVPRLRSQDFKPARWLFLGYLLSFLIIGFSFIFHHHQTRLVSDQSYARRMRCNRFLKKRLSEVDHYCKRGAKREFFGSLVQAILGYIGDRYNLETQTLTRDQLKVELARNGVKSEVIKDLIEVVDLCDHERFAPVFSAECKPEEVLRRARQILNCL